MNIVFMGTPDFAQKSLRKIVEAGHNILAVVTNPDKPKGRGGKLAFSEVKEYALMQGLEIYQPLKVRKNEEFINKIKELKPDVIVVVAYGKILPKELLDIPKFGSINVHGSLLPKLRGAAPIQWSVLNGDKITGITTMFMDEGMDTGDMILQETLEIGENENVGEVWNRMGDLGADLLEKTISNLEQVKTKLPNPKDFSILYHDFDMIQIEKPIKYVEKIHEDVRSYKDEPLLLCGPMDYACSNVCCENGIIRAISKDDDNEAILQIMLSYKNTTAAAEIERNGKYKNYSNGCYN